MSPAARRPSAPLSFKKNKSLLTGPGQRIGLPPVELELQAVADGDPKTAAALLENKPFPKLPVRLGRASVEVSAGDEVSFGTGKGKTSFSIGGGVFAELGVFKTAKSAFKAVSLDKQVVPPAPVEGADGLVFAVLQSAYSLAAEGDASIALAPGFTPSIEASVGRSRDFAVIRAIEASSGARDALQDVLDSWRLPRQVGDVADLDPGTWIVAEVDGSFAMGLEARYGYTYNWVKAARLGGLSGDIGLKIELGAAASLGFSASGKYALVIGRDSLRPEDERLRLRLHRLQQHGWNFAFDASASCTGDTDKFLPKQYDKLVAAVFGLDPGQLTDDLRRWTDPANAMPDLIAGESIGLAHRTLTHLTGIDAKHELAKAQEKLRDLLDRWDGLPNEVASRIWEALPNAEEIEKIADVARQIADADSRAAKAKAMGLIEQLLEEIDFFDSAIGKWVLATAMNRPLELLAAGVDSVAFENFRKIAGKTAAIIDGSELERMLTRFHDLVSEKLRVDLLRDLDKRSFEELDDWMKAKLSQFIGARIDFSDVDKVRRAIKVLDDNIDEFYDKTIQALNRQYEFSFAYRLQSATTTTALIDVTLDFAGGNLGAALRRVIAGDFDALLTQRQKGVTLHVAALTHGIERQASVDLTMPWIRKSTVSRSEALAELDVVDEDDGRLLVYASNASNKVTEVTNRGAAQSYRVSAFSVASQMPAKVGELKVHADTSLQASYTYAVAAPGMVLEDLIDHFGPYVRAYFPRQFGADDAPRFAVWATELDRKIDADPETANGPRLFGDTLVRLVVALPPETGAIWFAGSRRSTAPAYRKMSLSIQQALRDLLTFYYFADPQHFANRLAAHALLMYAATPPANGLRLDGDKIRKTNHSVHWDWADDKLRRAVMQRPATAERLAAGLQVVRGRLQGIPAAAGFADLYDSPDRVRRTLFDRNAVTLLKALYRMESIATRRAAEAAVNGAKFRRDKETRPADALEALAKFGIAATSAFNDDLSSGKAYGGAPLRPLGSLVYVEAMRALQAAHRGSAAAAPAGVGGASGGGPAASSPAAPETPPGTPLATFQLEVLRAGVGIPAAFPDHEPLEREKLAIRERIVNV